MIILDIETTGTDPKRHCMLSLGAVDFETGKEFYGECSIFQHSEVDPIALNINGMNIEDHQPGKKMNPIRLYLDFVDWAEDYSNILAGHNVGHFDILFLEHYNRISGQAMEFPFSFRTVDLHSVAFMVFRESLKHSDICKRLGLPPEPTPHHALYGARSERDAFKLLLK